jgi:hypothetical protein
VLVKDAYQDVLSEIAIMKELDHICLIMLHEIIDEVDGDKLYMGNADSFNGDLFSYRLRQVRADNAMGSGKSQIHTMLQREATILREGHSENTEGLCSRARLL